MSLELLPIFCYQNLITVSATYFLEKKNQMGSAQKNMHEL